jgi:hypothetical protein
MERVNMNTRVGSLLTIIVSLMMATAAVPIVWTAMSMNSKASDEVDPNNVAPTELVEHQNFYTKDQVIDGANKKGGTADMDVEGGININEFNSPENVDTTTDKAEPPVLDEPVKSEQNHGIDSWINDIDQDTFEIDKESKEVVLEDKQSSPIDW